MPAEPSPLEQAVSRTLRDNLERLQRTAEELRTAVADLVAACASSRPTNALPPMMRAQVSAASLAASLEVLAKFVTRALQPRPDTEEEKAEVRVISVEAPAPAAEPVLPPHTIPTPMAAIETPAVVEPVSESEDEAGGVYEPAVPVAEPQHFAPAQVMESPTLERIDLDEEAAFGESSEEAAAEVAEQAAAAAFDVAALPADEQELHRRANRVAKVSMQDIKLLRPEQVRLGREHRDLCLRLRDDIEKAHIEYDRRFRPILAHPVDYFYHWMVEILGEGDPQALGEYPYSSPVLRQ